MNAAATVSEWLLRHSTPAQAEISAAGKVAAELLKSVLVKEVEDAIEGNKKVSHVQLCEKVFFLDRIAKLKTLLEYACLVSAPFMF